MTFIDFEYDGILLSSLGCIVCSFDGEPEPNGTGNELTFNMVSVRHGEKFEFINSEYADSLELAFQICKIPCAGVGEYFSPEEVEYIASWLGRRKLHKFKIVEEGYEDLYFEASCNVKRITAGSNVCGFDITMKTNTPHPLREPITVTRNNLPADTSFTYECISSEEGNIHPSELIIKVLAAGDLLIKNEYDDSEMYIENCRANETITVNYPMITTSSNAHKSTILNDFNWSFYHICNEFNNHENSFVASLPCNVSITYTPIIKIGY